MTETATQTWHDLLETIIGQGGGVTLDGRAHEPRSRGTIELIGHQTRWEMSSPAIACPRRKLGYRFMAAEPAWIIRGSNLLEDIMPYAKHLATFSDDGVHLNGSYGPPFVDQLPYVVDALKSDLSTRQAVATFWRPRPGKWKDVPCTVALQWLLRSDHVTGAYELHCVATMRSSDAWLGIPYDVPTFSALSAYVALTLRKVAGRSIVDRLGQLVLTAGSQHLYQRDFEGARACVYGPRDPDLFIAQPLDLGEFTYSDGPRELLEHLDHLSRNDATSRCWLRETAQ